MSLSGQNGLGKAGAAETARHTIAYYEQNAKRFAKETVAVDFALTQNRFLDKLQPGGLILDFGCGAGRDTKCFLERGYRVEAVDGSVELCRLAQAYTGIKVRHMLFEDLAEINRYEGIWACASVLHLPEKELHDVLGKMVMALRKNGVIYLSFKYGTFAGERNGRFFTDMTEASFADFMGTVEGLLVEEQWVTSDVRPERGGEQWLNLILRKMCGMTDYSTVNSRLP